VESKELPLVIGEEKRFGATVAMMLMSQNKVKTQAMNRKRLVWKEAINHDFVNAVADLLNDSGSNDKIYIYLSSTGGAVAAERILLDMIENSESEIHLIIVAEIYSSAFSLFFLAKCNKKILPGTVGMIHTSSAPIDINHHGNPTYHEGVAWRKQLQREEKLETQKLIDLLELTETQKKKIMKGDDVFFLADEMQKFLEISERKRFGNPMDRFKK